MVVTLTARELQIARLIAQGMTYQEMGDELDLSPATVKAYTDQVRRLLGLKHKRHIPAKLRELGYTIDIT